MNLYKNIKWFFACFYIVWKTRKYSWIEADSYGVIWRNRIFGDEV